MTVKSVSVTKKESWLFIKFVILRAEPNRNITYVYEENVKGTAAVKQ